MNKVSETADHGVGVPPTPASTRSRAPALPAPPLAVTAEDDIGKGCVGGSASNDYATPAYNFTRLGYFCEFLGLSAIAPYASVLFASKGFSPMANGLLNAVNPLSVVFVVPPVAYFAETRGLQTTVVYVGVVCGSVLMAVMCLASSQMVVATAAVLYFVLTAPLQPTYDEHVTSVLGPAQRTEYGAFRVFGAYGWAIGAPLATFLFGHYGWGWTALMYVAGFGVLALCVWQTPVAKTRGSHSGRDVAKHIWSNPRIVNYLIAIACLGMGASVISTFLFLFLERDLGAEPMLLGLCIVFTVLIEIPLFRASEFLHRNFTDAQLFLGAVAGYVCRVIGYSFLQRPWFVLFLEPLHGATFGLMWLSGVHFFGGAFPKSLSNSAIGFLHASAWGVGPIVGNVMGGILFERLGPRIMFRCFAAVMLIVGVVFWVVDRHLEARLAAAGAFGGGTGDHKAPEDQAELRPSFGAVPPSALTPRMAIETPRHCGSIDPLPASAPVV